ncbi:MAG: hypothetical protein ABIN80_04400 [Dyadobacter sp.]|uniref:DUF6934 family protein n=1 Tax=Dyadobacter sp. TaxID=1914288 RepID=UPI0032659069
MKQAKYMYRSEGQLRLYEFTSEGPRGSVKKIVEYTETNTVNVYNLAFGDYDQVTRSFNDLSITDNGDSSKVLATVASTIFAFVEKYPDAWITATGSTVVRTRLYRMGITNNLAEISEEFVIFGYNSQGQWEEFVVDKDYQAFLLTKKNNWLAI